MTNITELIKNRNTLGLKYIVAKLISSWIEEESTYMTKLYFIVNIDWLFINFVLFLLIWLTCN